MLKFRNCGAAAARRRGCPSLVYALVFNRCVTRRGLLCEGHASRERWVSKDGFANCVFQETFACFRFAHVHPACHLLAPVNQKRPLEILAADRWCAVVFCRRQRFFVGSGKRFSEGRPRQACRVSSGSASGSRSHVSTGWPEQRFLSHRATARRPDA